MEQLRFTKEEVENLIKTEVETMGYEVVKVFSHTHGVMVDVLKLDSEKGADL